MFSPATRYRHFPASGRAAGAAILLAILVLLFSSAMSKRLDHDEHQFIASAALLLRQRRLPYRDYPYFHMPYLIFIYAAAFHFTDHLLLAGRMISCLCGFAVVAVVFVITVRIIRRQGEAASLGAGALAAAALVSNPIFIFTSGRAWNHDVPTLLAVLAFLAMVRALKRDSIAGAILAGLLMGIATGVRLTFLPPALALAGAPLLVSEMPLRRRMIPLLVYIAAFAAALLPALAIALKAPSAFYFGNFGYPTLNTAFRETTAYTKSMDSWEKIVFLFRDVLLQPSNFALAVVLVSLGFVRWQRAKAGARGLFVLQRRVLVLLFLSSLAAGCAPTPLFTPYFFTPLVFAVLWGAYTAAEIWEPGHIGARLKLICGICLGIEVALGVPYYRNVVHIAEPAAWVPVQVHRDGVALARNLSRKARVMTASPIFPLEGRLPIFSGFATGPFALRIGPALSEQQEDLYHVPDKDDLHQAFWSSHHAVLMTGMDAEADAVMLHAIGKRRLRRQGCRGGIVIWSKAAR